MSTITSSPHGTPGQGIVIPINTRVGICRRLPDRQFVRSGAPNSGLGACWGFAPSGRATINCLHLDDVVNQDSTEYLFNAVAFTTPHMGTLRLYANPAPGIQPQKVGLIIENSVHPPQADQEYELSQLFDNGQTVLVYPGAKEFDAPEGTTWLVIEGPVPYTWTPTGAATLKLTPTVVGIQLLVGGPIQATWKIVL